MTVTDHHYLILWILGMGCRKAVHHRFLYRKPAFPDTNTSLATRAERGRDKKDTAICGFAANRLSASNAEYQSLLGIISGKESGSERGGSAGKLAHASLR
jgi:hypothetical protein